MKHQWNGWVALVLHELRVRWSVFLILAALGLLAFLSPLFMDGFGASSAQDVRDATALTFSLLVTLGGALILGGQMVVHPLAEQRLAFYLARPISGWTFWWGQITTASIILAVGWWLVWLPTLLVGGSPWGVANRGASFNGPLQLPNSVPWSVPEPFAVIPVWSAIFPGVSASSIGWMSFWWILNSLACLLVGHWIYMVLRLRTRWALVDLILLAGAAWGGLYLLADLYQRMAYREQFLVLWGLIVCLLASALWAGGRQVVRGGTDAVRSHGVFSRTFWPWIFAFLGVMFAVHLWMDSRGPDDLKTLENLHASPDGQWLVVSGKPWRGGSYEAVFLMHPESGESLYLGPRFALPGPPIFSSQSTAVIWVQCFMDARDCQLHWKELRGERRQATLPVERENLQLYSTYRGRTLAISEDGSRVAMTYQGRLEVYDFPHGNLRIAQRLSQGTIAYPAFEGLDQVRVYHQIMRAVDSYVDLWRLDLMEETWTYEDSVSGNFVAVHDDADLFVLTQRWNRVVFMDRQGRRELGRTAEGRHILAFRVLSTRQVVTVEYEGDEISVLCVYDSEGRQIFSETLGEQESLLLGGEIEAGRLLVGRRQGHSVLLDPGGPGLWLPGFGALDDWQTQVFDVSQGWMGEPWPGVLPAWQVGPAFEQGRWLLSSQGVQHLEDGAEPQLRTLVAVGQ